MGEIFEGWVLLHRKIKDSWIWESPPYLKAWLTIILTVNYTDNKVIIQGKLYQCKRGQSLLSVCNWAKAFGKGWTRQRVRTFFTLLVKDHMITIDGLQKTTRLTVCNYDTYQNPQPTNNQQRTNRKPQTNNELNNDKESGILKIKTIPENAR